MTAEFNDWRQVSFAADCLYYDDDYDDTGEPGNVCSVCEGEYATCPCPGRTMDGYEYKEVNGILFARPNTKLTDA